MADDDVGVAQVEFLIGGEPVIVNAPPYEASASLQCLLWWRDGLGIGDGC